MPYAERRGFLCKAKLTNVLYYLRLQEKKEKKITKIIKFMV